MADSNDTGLTVFGVLEQARQHLQAAYSLVGAVTEDFPAPDEQKDTGQRDLVLQVLHGYENLQEAIDLLSPMDDHIDWPLGEIGVRAMQAAKDGNHSASTQAVSLPANPLVDEGVPNGTLSRAAHVLKYLQVADINAAGNPSEDVLFGQHLILQMTQEAIEHTAQLLEVQP